MTFGSRAIFYRFLLPEVTLRLIEAIISRTEKQNVSSQLSPSPPPPKKKNH